MKFANLFQFHTHYLLFAFVFVVCLFFSSLHILLLLLPLFLLLLIYVWCFGICVSLISYGTCRLFHIVTQLYIADIYLLFVLHLSFSTLVPHHSHGPTKRNVNIQLNFIFVILLINIHGKFITQHCCVLCASLR